MIVPRSAPTPTVLVDRCSLVARVSVSTAASVD